MVASNSCRPISLPKVKVVDLSPILPTTMRTRGFTLIEVLIALAVVAIALLALLGTTAEDVRVSRELRDRTLADWVAWNQVEQARLATTPPPLGWTDGIVRMGGRRWQWRMDAQRSVLPGLYKIRVEVSPAKRYHDVLAVLNALVTPPSPAAVEAEQSPNGTLPNPASANNLPYGLGLPPNLGDGGPYPNQP